MSMLYESRWVKGKQYMYESNFVLNNLLKNCQRVNLVEFTILTGINTFSESNQIRKNCYVVNSKNQLVRLAISNLSEIDLNCLDQCCYLKVLILQNCGIISLPKKINRLTNLEYLDLSYNKIRELPSNFIYMMKLRSINLSNNELASLPSNFGQLIKLTHLNLFSNRLQQLPQNMALLEKLKHIELEKNQFSFNVKELRPFSVRNQILTILKIQKGNSSPLNEAKILVVGDERAGKSSLVRRLKGMSHDKNQITTQGIDISCQQLANGILVNVWDFAGQEITHQTHHFFLSQRSLYLYVIDSQKEDNDNSIHHWLSVIKAYGGDKSPVIVVVTKRDQNCSYYFDRQRYQREFNIVDVIYTTACNEADIDSAIFNNIEHNIEDLQKAIDRSVSTLEGVDFPIPENWSSLKRSLIKLQSQNVDFIQQREYVQFCQDHRIDSQDEQKTLLKLLNDIGTVVAFPDERRLRLTQVINPLWVTNAVYKIIRSNKVYFGMLSIDDMESILKGETGYDYHDEHLLWLMDLLNQFELSFNINANSVLLPSRLQISEPYFDLESYNKGLQFRFTYKDILKKSVISQLTVRLHHYVDQDSPRYWKRGVFLGLRDCKAVVISDENKKQIDIKINKNSRSARELLAHLREEIQAINDVNLSAIGQVPLYFKGKIVGYEDYEHVVEAEQEGDKSMRLRIEEPDTGLKKSVLFPINILLDGYRPEVQTFDYQKLTEDLLSIAVKMSERRNAIYDESENHTNDRFCDALYHKGYQVADNSRSGDSSTGKQSGECDLIIRNSHGCAESIIEALILNCCDKTQIRAHYKKLTEFYDTNGNQRNFILIYYKAKNFEEAWGRYTTLISDEFCGIYSCQRENSIANVKTCISSFKDREVYHIFINLFSLRLNNL